MDVQGALTLSRQNGAGTVSNAGTLTKSGSGTSYFAIPFSNTGTTNIQNDTLRLAGDGTHTGIFTVPAAGVLYISAGTHTLSTDLTGAGAVRFGAGTFTLNGTYSFPQVNVEGGTVVLNGPVTAPGGIITAGTTTFADVVAASDSLIVSAGSATFNSTVGLPGFIRLSGNGAIAGTADISVGDSLLWTGGSLNTSGTTTIGAAAQVTMSTAGIKYIRNGTISNSGSIVWSGGVFYSYTGGSLTNLAGATMDVQGALDQSGGCHDGRAGSTHVEPTEWCRHRQ
jgi:hypothetical protein